MLIGALEAGGTKMVMAVGEENGRIVDKTELPTKAPEETMESVISYFRRQKPERLGIGSFGPVCLDKERAEYGHLLETPKLLWRNFDILGTLERELQIPCCLDTDVNVAALGEAAWGNARDVKSSVYITVGTGIGAGIIIDGRPLHGLLHPEAGHIPVRMAARDSFTGCCPYHGACLEGMASGPAIEKRWGKRGIELSECREVWELEAYYLAQAIVSYIMILSPQRILLGGGVMHQEQLMPLIREQVRQMLGGYIRMPELEALDSYIVRPLLQDEQGIKGCIRLATLL